MCRPLPEVYSFDQSFLKDRISYIQTDENKHLWICTWSGKLYQFDGSLKLAYQAPSSQTLYRGMAATDSTFWVICDDQLMEVNKKGTPLSTDTLAFDAASLLHDLEIYGEGNLLLNFWSESDTSTQRLTYCKKRGQNLQPFTIKTDTSQTAQPLTSSTYHYLFPIDDQTLCYIEGQDNNRFMLLNHRGKVLYSRPLSDLNIPPYSGEKIFVDNNNLIWVPTLSGLAVLNIRRNPFRQFLTEPVAQSTRAIIPLSDTSVWVNSDRGLKVLDLKNEKIIAALPLGNDLKHAYLCYGGMQMDYDRMLLGTYTDELFIIDRNTFKIAQELRLPEGLYGIPYRSEKTGRIWIGTTHGLFEFDPMTNQLQKAGERMPATDRSGHPIHIRSFYECPAGIWLVTSDGLLLFDEKKGIEAHYNHFPFNDFLHLHIDKEGIFWLASRGGGLIRWDRQKDKIEQFTKESHGLSNNLLYAVYEDETDHLWLPSNRGLMRFDKKNEEATVYLPEDGLPHEEFNTTSHLQMKDGRLLFGGLSGLISFYPDKLPANNFSSPIKLLAYKELGASSNEWEEKTQEIVKKGRIQLPHNVRSFLLEFTLMNFFQTDKHHFAYQVEGYNEEWTFIPENLIRFNQLPTGDYLLNIKARDGTGRWSEQVLSIPISVAPPFYLETWFILLFLAFLAGIVFLAIRWRTASLRASEKRLAVEVHRQTKELIELNQVKDKLFSVIGHELRNPMAAMQGIEANFEYLLKKGDLDRARKMIRLLENSSKNLNQLLDNLLYWGMAQNKQLPYRPYSFNVDRMIRKLLPLFDFMLSNKNILIHHQFDQGEMVYADESSCNIIIRNLIGNAIKFTPSGGCIHICTSSKKGQTMVCVKDNGKGMTPEQLSNLQRPINPSTRGTQGEKGAGLGIALCYELAEKNEGRLSFESRPEGGTTVTLTLPNRIS